MEPSAVPDPVACVRRVLDAVRAKSGDVEAQLHPAWVRGFCERVGVRAEGPPRARRWSQALAAFYQLQWPPLERFQSRGHRIALLPRAELLRVLAAVALHAERGRVRLSIGPGLRAAFVERVGETAYSRMLEAPPLLQPTSRGFDSRELNADRLAALGMARLVEADEWHSRALLDWVRLAIAPQPDDTPTPLRAAPGDALDCLSTYFPEHAWLFGSPMDRALSASTTA